MVKMLANRNGYRQKVLYLRGVSLESFSGVCLWSVSLGCVTEVCHWGVSLWGVSLGCVSGGMSLERAPMILISLRFLPP